MTSIVSDLLLNDPKQ